jgi:CDP-diacylglycerol--serine O-phosphatidyltransferase
MGGWPWLTSHGLTVKGISYPMMSLVLVLLAFLMVSSIRFRSFKDLKLGVFSVVLLIVIIGSSLVLWFWFKPAYILIWLLCLYVAIGFGEAILFWPIRRHGRLRSQDGKPTL